MKKQYMSNSEISSNPFDINLLNSDGNLAEYYILTKNSREKINLSGLINNQINFIGKGDRDIGSNDDYAKIASSGHNAKIASSGHSAIIVSSGNSANIASSGHYAKIASSGYDAKIASSGGYASIALSGNSASIASSGNRANIDVKGDNGVVFACGFNTIIKASKKTWISLCEYVINDFGECIPVYAASAQIDNPEYKDMDGNTLSEDEYYILKNKKFTPVIFDDGLALIKKQSKVKDGIEVCKCTTLNDEDNVYCVRKGKLSAHGTSLRQAMSDLAFKEMKNRNVEEVVKKIKECGYVTREDYRCITGACSFGTEQFAKEHGYADKDKVELNELLSVLDNKYYGAIKFKSLFKSE